jgi:glycosyltransferase involved in cell wall biosynthesis
LLPPGEVQAACHSTACKLWVLLHLWAENLSGLNGSVCLEERFAAFRMRILFLSPRQSLPARSGAKLREFHFLRALAQSAEISYLYFIDPGSSPLTAKDLPFCREVVGVPKPPAYGAAKTAMGILGSWPLPILNYTSPEMSAAVSRALDVRDFDIIHLDSIHMIRYAQAAAQRKPALPAIYNWHNIESEAMHRYSATTASFPRRWYAGQTARKLEILESNILQTAFGHIVCSTRERDKLLQIAPGARAEVVENGVDTRYFAEQVPPAPTGTRRQIVFVGAMDYFPNSEAAVFFANNIWPRMKSSLGVIELAIVGANPGPPVLALGKLWGVKVTGMVPDVRPWYRGALAAVVPLRTGAGTRLKILEAMAAGVPVISTPLGAEGLEVTDGENILLVDADDTQGWIDAVASVAESPALNEKLVAGGLRLVQTRYDWEILGAKLRKTYEDWLRPR